MNSNTPKPAKSHITPVRVFFWCVLLALAIAGWLAVSNRNPPANAKRHAETTTAAESKRAELARRQLISQLNEIEAVAGTRSAGMILATSRQGEQAVENAYRRARAAIPGTVDDLCSLTNCAKLCLMMAKDKFNGTNSAESHIQQKLEEQILRHVLAAERASAGSLANLQEQLRASSTQCATDLMAAVKVGEVAAALGQTENFRTVASRVTTESARIKDISLGTTTSIAGLGVSALLIRSTYASASRVLASLVARFSATQVTAATCVVADGPLPIGDIIAVFLEIGVGVWCAYDLHKAQGEMRGTLTASLTTSLTDAKAGALQHYRKNVAALKAKHDQVNQQMVQAVKTSL